MGLGYRYEQNRKRLKREAAVCHWCGGPIDPDLPASSPWSFEADHVVPRRYGGGHEMENLRAMHRRCNRQRGNGRRNPRTLDDRSAAW